MPKQGFKNQWIAISQVGNFADSKGVARDLNENFLTQVVANTKANDAPAVVGHPEQNAPAFGWANDLRMNEGVLEAKFADTDDEFEGMVERGLFRKRSASFYLNPPSLRHVGFLGAMPPAVKGLKEINFEEGESVTFDISFSEEKEKMGLEDKDVEKVSDSVFDKLKSLFKPVDEETEIVKEVKATSDFSEESVKTLIADALDAKEKQISADFSAKLDAKQKEIDDLKKNQDASTANGRKAEIANFVESIPAEKGKHFLKRAGIAEFMESLAEADSSDGSEAICFSEGVGDDKVTHKFNRVDWFKNYVNGQQSFVSFGEKFGSIKVSADAAIAVNTEDVDELRAGMDIKKKSGGEK